MCFEPCLALWANLQVLDLGRIISEVTPQTGIKEVAAAFSPGATLARPGVSVVD